MIRMTTLLITWANKNITYTFNKGAAFVISAIALIGVDGDRFTSEDDERIQDGGVSESVDAAATTRWWQVAHS